MADQNPWHTEESQGHPYNSPTQSQPPSQQTNPPPSHEQSRFPQEDASNPWSTGQDSETYQSGAMQPPNLPPRGQEQTPGQGIQRIDSGTEALLASQGDRAEQMETMQAYEATHPQSEDDKLQAQLQKEFPNIDSSLIAAMYSDAKAQATNQGSRVSIGELRETLQELS